MIIYHCKIFSNDNFIAAAIMSICVPLFFAVNGFLMLKKERSIKNITYKNLKILFLIVFWGIFTNLCLVLMWKDGHIDAKSIIMNLYNLKINYCNHLWFLCTLIVLNAINPLIYYYINRGSNKQTYIIILFILLFCQQFGVLTKGGVGAIKGFLPCSLIYYIITFAVLTGWYRCKDWSNARLVIIFFISWGLQALHNWLILNISIASRFLSTGDLVFAGYSSLWVVMMTLSCVILATKIAWPDSRIVKFIADNTLGLYLIHWILVRVLRTYTTLDETPFQLLITVVFVSCLIVFLIRKIRYVDYLIKV